MEMKSRKFDLSVNGLYLGAFAHADDIRTASTNATDATDATDQVKTGTKDNPSLNTLAGLPVENSVKFLGGGRVPVALVTRA